MNIQPFFKPIVSFIIGFSTVDVFGLGLASLWASSLASMYPPTHDGMQIEHKAGKQLRSIIYYQG